MTKMQHRWRTRCWSAPDFFEQLRRENEFECIDELVRSFTYFTSARLELLADPRALTEPEALLELRNLKDSCRQVGADRMSFICGEIEKNGLNPEADAFRYLMETLREEGHGVMHDMRAYAIGLKSQTMSAAACSGMQARNTDSALSGGTSPNNVVSLTDSLTRQQRSSHIVRVPKQVSVPVNAKKI